MSELSSVFETGAARRLRLDTLVRLRWLAVAGQVLAVLGVYFGLGFALPLPSALIVVAMSAILNLVLRAKYPVSYRMAEGPASILLAYDIVQLAVLLYLTGGLQNPFVSLFLAPVMISATVLPPVRTFALGVLAITLATFLAFWHMPLPWFEAGWSPMPYLYMGGVWAALLLGLSFIGVYAWRVAEEARQLSGALTATELVLAREQHLSQLDGLAAAAAHELGTPLATIALVVKELDRSVEADGPLRDDVALLLEQTARCRNILAKITSLGDEKGGSPLDRMKLGHLLEEVTAPQRSFGIDLDVTLHGVGEEPDCLRNPGILYGMGNLVDNAVDFAESRVTLRATWDMARVTISIADDGPGFAHEVLGRLGEPYVTSRAARGRDGRHGAGGLGLGLFIAKTLLERSGATFDAANASAPKHGAVVKLSWSRAAFDGRTKPQGPPKHTRVPILY